MTSKPIYWNPEKNRQTMKNITLDQEEQDLLEAFEAGEFQSVMTPERKQFIEAAAKQFCQQNKRVNIKVSESDLTSIQKAALQQGIPYQVFITSILHKYASGMLYEVSHGKANASAPTRY